MSMLVPVTLHIQVVVNAKGRAVELSLAFLDMSPKTMVMNHVQRVPQK